MTLTISHVCQILVESETELKEAQEEVVSLSKQLYESLKENNSCHKEIIHLNKLLADTHNQYATRLKGFAHAIIHSRNRLKELKEENAQLKRDLSPRD